MNPDFHTIQEAKVRVSMEVAAFRRELDAMKAEREAYLREREEEALKTVADVMSGADSLLATARDVSMKVDGYLNELNKASDSLRSARSQFVEWKDAETLFLKNHQTLLTAKAAEMAQEAERLSLERMRLEGAKRGMDLSSEQARKDLSKAKKEREKLIKNLEYVRRFAGPKQGHDADGTG